MSSLIINNTIAALRLAQEAIDVINKSKWDKGHDLFISKEQIVVRVSDYRFTIKAIIDIPQTYAIDKYGSLTLCLYDGERNKEIEICHYRLSDVLNQLFQYRQSLEQLETHFK